MYAEVHSPTGFVEALNVPDSLVPDHVYCDTCGDCLICQAHEEESYCRTGGRWVLYTDDAEDAALIAAVRAARAAEGSA